MHLLQDTADGVRGPTKPICCGSSKTSCGCRDRRLFEQNWERNRRLRLPTGLRCCPSCISGAAIFGLGSRKGQWPSAPAIAAICEHVAGRADHEPSDAGKPSNIYCPIALGAKAHPFPFFLLLILHKQCNSIESLLVPHIPVGCSRFQLCGLG